MKSNWKNYVLCILLGAVLMGFALYTISSKHNKIPDNTPNIIRDTLVIYDTIRIDKPVIQKVKVVDTLLVAVRDTVTINDTTYIYLEKTEAVYADSLYRLQISGYKPHLDWIEVYPTHISVIEKEVQYITSSKKWGFGIQIGYGMSVYNRQVYANPYIGVGVSYNFIRW